MTTRGRLCSTMFIIMWLLWWPKLKQFSQANQFFFLCLLVPTPPHVGHLSTCDILVLSKQKKPIRMARELVYSILSHNLKVYSRRGLNLWGDWILLPNCLYEGCCCFKSKTLALQLSMYCAMYLLFVQVQKELSVLFVLGQKVDSSLRSTQRAIK